MSKTEGGFESIYHGFQFKFASGVTVSVAVSRSKPTCPTADVMMWHSKDGLDLTGRYFSQMCFATQHQLTPEQVLAAMNWAADYGQVVE